MKLTALSVKNAPDGKHFDGNGLELRKKDGTGSWVWRYSFAGSRKEMGLGSYPSVSLSNARKERDRWKSILAQGNDPITERKAQIEATRQEILKDRSSAGRIWRNEVFARPARQHFGDVVVRRAAG